MENLKRLCKEMKAQKLASVEFLANYDGHELVCKFKIGKVHHKLCLSTVEKVSYVIQVDIGADFSAPSLLPHGDYIALANYLEYAPNKKSPFRPSTFFEELDSKCIAYQDIRPFATGTEVQTNVLNISLISIKYVLPAKEKLVAISV